VPYVAARSSFYTQQMHVGIAAFTAYGHVGVMDLAQAVEEAGLESLFLVHYTHLTAGRRALLEKSGGEGDPISYTERPDILDPFVALGAAAAVTRRLNLGTGACYPAVYDPILLAKQGATLDQISQGRFLFGVTAGWDDLLFRNHGIDPALRWQVMREKVLAVKALWTESEAEFHGRFVNFEPVARMQPFQSPHPPVLVGSHGIAGLRRVVEYGDEWFPVLTPDLNLEQDMRELARLCNDAGREPALVTVVIGNPDQAVMERCAQAGVHRCAVMLTPRQRADVDSTLERCANVAPLFTA
jgi:probable F420-dependent oxidoreductase